MMVLVYKWQIPWLMVLQWLDFVAKKLDVALLVHQGVGFNMKHLCQWVENANFCRTMQHLLPQSPCLVPTLICCRGFENASFIILHSTPHPPPHLSLMLSWEPQFPLFCTAPISSHPVQPDIESLLLCVMVSFSDLVPVCFGAILKTFHIKKESGSLNKRFWPIFPLKIICYV